MNIVSPFGKPNAGTGTFDCLFDSEKYNTMQDATLANDYVEGNYVNDEGTLKIEFHHIADTQTKKYYTLFYQNCPFGIDAMDDNLACEIGITLFKK